MDGTGLQMAMPNTEYLIVDQFLKSELDAKALDFALRLGLIDQLQAKESSFQQIPVRNPIGRQIFVDLLVANNVLQKIDERIALTQHFHLALQFRELLEAKIAFLGEVSPDVSRNFIPLIDDLPVFMERSATFALFRYDRCFEATPSNFEITRRWMRYTTALTRHEGRVLATLINLEGITHLLDVGGNSGELALQICDAAPHINVTVFDLPLVCIIGREHIETRKGKERIRFQPGDMRRDALPHPVDAIVFKSALHDWPQQDAAALVRKAADALRPGGLLIIFERGPLRAEGGLTYADLANLMFYEFFRPKEAYLNLLAALPLTDIRHETIRLDMDFHLITARRNG